MIRAGRAPRLVGRGREVADLEAELKQASTGSARAVMLITEPGVGKSRLAAEKTGPHGDRAAALIGLALLAPGALVLLHPAWLPAALTSV